MTEALVPERGGYLRAEHRSDFCRGMRERLGISCHLTCSSRAQGGMSHEFLPQELMDECSNKTALQAWALESRPRTREEVQMIDHTQYTGVLPVPNVFLR